MNGEDGLNEEEDGDERGRWITERDTEENIPEQPKAEPENPDRVRDTGGRRTQEPSEEAPKPRHVPGGAWLSKTEAYLFTIPQTAECPEDTANAADATAHVAAGACCVTASLSCSLLLELEASLSAAPPPHCPRGCA
ncbi:hypothetical protein NDU88_005993 [Pleurodeles waltl]|uniref:Uncharacterized protein n=1 Tax=Pleurodeles waltl TaxID=8319 RepID=A0AAV7RNC4_PLEWA|nr:hypothetical protein NDU88_005993 [Pleurodeles waltl]